MIRNEHTFPKDSFLGQIDDDSWNLLSTVWRVHTYQSGQFLINVEEETRDVFFVLRGSARATIYTRNGKEVSIISILEGSCFGEFSAIDNSPRSASVVASRECYAARLDQDSYIKLLKNNPDLSFTLLRILVKHLRIMSQRVVEYSTYSADQRLHFALLDLARANKLQKNGEVIIEYPPTQNELASFIVASREGVAREMGRLRKNGLIMRQRRALVIPNLSKLEKFIEGQRKETTVQN